MRHKGRVCKAYDRRGQLTGLLAGRQDEIACGAARTISDPGDVGTDGLGHHHLQYTRSHDGLIERLTDLSAHVGAGGNQSTPDGPLRLDAAYAYDTLQQLTSATDADGTTLTYQYDLIQNLVGRFATDQKGERIAALGLPDGEFTYGENAGPNAITSAGCGKSKTPGTRCDAFEYDQAGQMKRYHGYDLHFGAEGRLVEAQNTDTGQRLQYFYDAWGERRLILLHRNEKPVEVHRFVFPEYQERDGERVWHAGGGGAATEIVESEGVKVDLTLLGEVAAWKSGERTSPKPLPAEYQALTYEEALRGYETGKRVGGKKTVWRYVTTDHLGGATHVTDSEGDLVSWQRFEAYGKTRDRSGQAFLRGYIGTEVEPDLDLGLIRMGARYYAPELGRFVTADPLIGQDPTLMAGRVLESGLYAYAANNPIMGKDPTCHWVNFIVGAISGVLLDLTIQGIEAAVGARTEVDWTSLGVSVATGAVGGGLISKLGKIKALASVGEKIASKSKFAAAVASRAGNAAADVGVGVVAEETKQALGSGEGASGGTVVADFVGSLAGQAAGKKVTESLRRQARTAQARGQIQNTISDMAHELGAPRAGLAFREAAGDSYRESIAL